MRDVNNNMDEIEIAIVIAICGVAIGGVAEGCVLYDCESENWMVFCEGGLCGGWGGA